MGNTREIQSQDEDEEQIAGQNASMDRCQGSPSSWVWEEADDALVWRKSRKLHDGLS